MVTHVRASGTVAGVTRYAAHEIRGVSVRSYRMSWRMSSQGKRDAEVLRARALFRRKYGCEAQDVVFIGYAEGVAMTDKELAGLLMEQEHDLNEHDTDSECPGDTPCVQCPPRAEKENRS